jgi:hypothetical protein
VSLLLLSTCARSHVTEPRPAGSPLTSTELAARKRQLARIVDKHTGSAHFTRGMNSETIEALANAATKDDLPVLEELLADHDRIVAMTAAEVLMRFGEDGRPALERGQALARARGDVNGEMMIEERLHPLRPSTMPPHPRPR